MNNQPIQQQTINPGDAQQIVADPNAQSSNTTNNVEKELLSVKPISVEVKDATQGVNLIPSLTKEEEVKVKTKNKLSIGSLLSIIIFVLVSIAIVAFNIVTKNQLTVKQKELRVAENLVNQKIDKIVANNIILDRINLYKDVKSNSFSHKKVISYLRDMGAKVQSMRYDTIEISEDLSFKMTGGVSDLEQLSRLWYLFGVDKNIETIKLKTFSKTNIGASFTFEGKFVLDNFKND